MIPNKVYKSLWSSVSMHPLKRNYRSTEEQLKFKLAELLFFIYLFIFLINIMCDTNIIRKYFLAVLFLFIYVNMQKNKIKLNKKGNS